MTDPVVDGVVVEEKRRWSLLRRNRPNDVLAPPPDAFEESEKLLVDPVLLLRRTETALVRANLACPGVIEQHELDALRHLISFARLGKFGYLRFEFDLSADVAELRRRVVSELADPLRKERDARARLYLARAALETLTPVFEVERQTVLDAHRNDFPAEALDREVTNREFVLVLGGGAGAGHVYLGALALLFEHGLMPAYVLGTSIGSMYGGIACRTPEPNMDELVRFAHSLTRGDVLAPPRRKSTHGMTGLFSLKLGTPLAPMLTHPDGSPVRLRDMGIPFEAVLAGVREGAFVNLPKGFRTNELVKMTGRLGSAASRSTALAARMWQVGAFFDSRMVKPIVAGADDNTAGMRVVDAIGFSCAVPRVLHYESDDPRETERLDQLLKDKGVRALVDGGAISNVPAELAWRRVQDGRIGTRNAVVIAFDSFQPQFDPRHLWLTPITQAIQLQMVRNAPFADWIRRFSPTLGVLDLVPGPERFERAAEWGRAALEPDLELMTGLLRPTPWR